MLANSGEMIANDWAGADESAPFMAEDRPLCLVAGSRRRRRWLMRIAERSGLRALGGLAPEIAGGPVRTGVADLALLDLRGAEGMDWLREKERNASLVRARLAVLVDLAGLDEALALLGGADMEILCDPTESDIIAMLVLAGLGQTGSMPTQLHDVTHDRETARLEKLSEEVRRLATTIERLSGPRKALLRSEEAGGDRSGVPPVRMHQAIAEVSEPAFARSHEQSSGATAAEHVPDHAEINALIRARRLREEFLPADLFADPAWDMLLDLLVARLAGRQVSVSSLCIAAAVPPTTALRWIGQLTERGIFMRIDDPLDGRRVFIDLTDKAATAMLGWVHAIRRKGGLLAAPAR